MINAKQYIYRNGVFYTKGTLAQYLDKRSFTIGEPTAAVLPATINPLRFLLDTLLKNNAVIIRIKQKAVKTKPEILALLSKLKEFTPPEQYIFLCFEMDTISDSLDLSSIEETVVAGSGLAATESITITDTERVTLGELE